MTRRSYFGNFAAGVMPISLPALANAQENTTGNQHPDATPDLTGFGVKGDGNTDITNGEFVSMHGDERIQVVVEPTCNGSVRLVNCAFGGPARQCVLSHSQSVVSLSNCYLEISGRSPSGMLPEVSLVEADSGRLQVRGCSFKSRGKEPHIILKQGLKHAIVSENNGVGGLDIVNDVGGEAIIVNNEPRLAEVSSPLRP